MEIEHRAFEMRKKGRGEHKHVAGQRNGLSPRIMDGAEHVHVKGCTVGIFCVVESDVGDVKVLGAFKNFCLRTIAENKTDFEIQNSFQHFIDHGLSIGATARSENGEFHQNIGVETPAFMQERKRRLRCSPCLLIPAIWQ